MELVICFCISCAHVIAHSSLHCKYFHPQTTSVHALARQLLGSAYTNGVLELNASDSRGIDVSLLHRFYHT